MKNQITVLVQGQKYFLNRQLLLSQSQSSKYKTDKNITLPLPQWVKKQVYLLIEQYLKTKDIQFLHKYEKDNDIMVKLLRASDYLELNKFENKLIEQIIIPGINNDNCLVILKEVQTKLRNAQGQEVWYKLLTVGIQHLADNLFHIYHKNYKELTALGSKIMYQIFDQAIKKERQKNFPNHNILFKLITIAKTNNSKSATQSQNLCKNLRNSLAHKKITYNIHGNLLWKLQKMSEINEKKTKAFKFIDLQWQLSAKRVHDGLLVCLNFIPYDLSQSQVSMYSSSSGTTKKSFNVQQQNFTPSSNSMYNLQKGNNNKVFSKSDEQIIKGDRYSKVGVFYSKVVLNLGDTQEQKQLRINYFPLRQRNQIPIILFDHEFQKKFGPKKLSFRIYCNIDQIYTFVLNYIYHNFDALTFKGSNFYQKELLAMINVAKSSKQYTLALRLTAQFVVAFPNEKTNLTLKEGYDFTKMTEVEIQIYQNLICTQAIKKQGFTKKKTGNFLSEQKKLKNLVITPIGSTTLSKKQRERLKPQMKTYEEPQKEFYIANKSIGQRQVLQNQRTLSSNWNRSQQFGQSSKQQSRANSKRKIFAGNLSSQLLIQHKNSMTKNLMEETLKVTDFSNYIRPGYTLN